MDSNRTNFPHQSHIEDDPFDDYERGPAREITPSERREEWANTLEPAGMRQTLGASYHDGTDMGMSSRINDLLDGPFLSLPSTSAPFGNTYHIPPFSVLAENAGAGAIHRGSSPVLPPLQASTVMPGGFGQAPRMPPVGAFLNSTVSPQQLQRRPIGQFELPRFSSQENAYAAETGRAYPRDLPAPRMLPTMDPNELLQRQISTAIVHEETASESEVEIDNGDDSDRGWDQQFDGDDADGWGRHPDTIGLGIPRFSETMRKGDMRDAAGARVPVVMHARFVLKKRVARQHNFWILYRRNYFGIQGSYTLEPRPDSSPEETLYLHRGSQKREPIQALLMCMRGVMESEDGPEIKIVVFNAKRKPLHVGDNPPPIEPQRMKPLTAGSTRFYAESTGDRRDHLNIPMNHTFHRNQFRAATQNNGVRRNEQQFYHILLELKAEIMVDGVPKLFTIASQMSEPLVVRGRCPLSFKDKDKKSHTRDPDRKGRKPPRDGGEKGSKRCSVVKSQKDVQGKGASCGAGNKGSSRRSTQSAANLPSLRYGTGSRSTNADDISRLPTSRTSGTDNRSTLPRLDQSLLTLRQGHRKGDPPWLPGHNGV